VGKFNWTTLNTPSREKAHTVQSQIPRPGSSAKRGETVSVYIYQKFDDASPNATARPNSFAPPLARSPAPQSQAARQPTPVAAVPPRQSGNAADQLIGTWQGARHVMSYSPDGTFYSVDPNTGTYPLGHWRLTGNQLTEDFVKGARQTYTFTVSATELTMVDSKGQVFRLTRVRQ
jgi:hypothetical protein